MMPTHCGKTFWTYFPDMLSVLIFSGSMVHAKVVQATKTRRHQEKPNKSQWVNLMVMKIGFLCVLSFNLRVFALNVSRLLFGFQVRFFSVLVSWCLGG